VLRRRILNKQASPSLQAIVGLWLSRYHDSDAAVRELVDRARHSERLSIFTTSILRIRRYP
jgi:hypothetical protein